MERRLLGQARRIALTDRLIAIGASAGGPQAIEFVLRHLPAVMPPIVIVQHMPEVFTLAFARRLDELCTLTVREAAQGDLLKPGLVLIAPGGRHLTLRRLATDFVVQLDDNPPYNRHRPSVDVLFRSVIACGVASALGLVLTGMGNDGAQGLCEMREHGFATLAQDEGSSMVWGMPRAAKLAGAVDERDILSLASIPSALQRFALQKK